MDSLNQLIFMNFRSTIILCVEDFLIDFVQAVVYKLGKANANFRRHLYEDLLA